MGCDIHLHTEIKINGKWEHYSKPSVKRSYLLFAKMANVRNDGTIKPMAEPKGLPDDITNTTKFCSDYEGSDGHSHSWLESYEVSNLITWFEVETGQYDVGVDYLFGNGWNNWKSGDSDGYPEGLESFRWVFWFDN